MKKDVIFTFGTITGMIVFFIGILALCWIISEIGLLIMVCFALWYGRVKAVPPKSKPKVEAPPPPPIGKGR